MMETGVRSQESGEKPGSAAPGGFDVLFLFLLWFTLSLLCVRGLVFFSETKITAETATKTSATKIATKKIEHPLVQFVMQTKKHRDALPALFIALFTAFASAVVLAPLTEEFLFRYMLQGWLHTKCSAPLAVVAASLFFASLHGGRPSAHNSDVLMYVILGNCVANFLTLCLGGIYLCNKYRLPLPLVLGLTRKYVCSDLFWGIAYFFSIGIVVLALSSTLRSFFPDTVTDPIPLFFFALVLGFLFQKTGRLLPSIALHASLNGFSYAALVVQAMFL